MLLQVVQALFEKRLLLVSQRIISIEPTVSGKLIQSGLDFRCLRLSAWAIPRESQLCS